MIATLLSLVASPLFRVAGYALLAMASVTGVYVKGRRGRVQVHVREATGRNCRTKKADADAIAAANAARDAALKKFDNGGFSAHPGGVLGRLRHGSDGFARD